MKKFIFFIFIFCFSALNFTYGAQVVFSSDNKFGVKDEEKILIEAEYSKLIRLGDKSYIAQKKNKYGIIDLEGNVLAPFKYSHAERILGKWAKLGNFSDFGLYSEEGKMVLPHKYNDISLLFSGMLLTYRNYLYGVADFQGNIILENKFEEIYMPKANTMCIQYGGVQYEIEAVSSDSLVLPKDISQIHKNANFKMSNLVVTTGATSGYAVLTFSDYVVKILSSISPSHEATIDELMFSKGVDTIPVLLKFSWIPKYPYVYARYYYKTFINPYSGLFSDYRSNLKEKIK